jgi:hypothetical protein
MIERRIGMGRIERRRDWRIIDRMRGAGEWLTEGGTGDEHLERLQTGDPKTNNLDL